MSEIDFGKLEIFHLDSEEKGLGLLLDSLKSSLRQAGVKWADVDDFLLDINLVSDLRSKQPIPLAFFLVFV